MNHTGTIVGFSRLCGVLNKSPVFLEFSLTKCQYAYKIKLLLKRYKGLAYVTPGRKGNHEASEVTLIR